MDGDIGLPNGLYTNNASQRSESVNLMAKKETNYTESSMATSELKTSAEEEFIVQEFIDDLITETLNVETQNKDNNGYNHSRKDRCLSKVPSVCDDPHDQRHNYTSKDMVTEDDRLVDRESIINQSKVNIIRKEDESDNYYSVGGIDLVSKSIGSEPKAFCVLELNGDRQTTILPPSDVPVQQFLKDTIKTPQTVPLHQQVKFLKEIQDCSSIPDDRPPTPEAIQSVSRNSPTHISSDDDKLSKFKALAVKLKKDLARSKGEIQATNDKLVLLNEKLNIAEKENSRVTLLYSQQVRNFNSLQAEYDRILDDYETIKKKFRLNAQNKSDDSIKDLKVQLEKKSNTIFELESKLSDIRLQVEQKDQLKSKLRDMTEIIQSTEKKYHIALKDLELLRSEHTKVSTDRASYKNDCKQLGDKLSTLQEALESERINHEKLRASFETKVQSLKQQLQSSQDDLHSLNLEFENYKIKVSQLMQDSNLVQANTIRTFEQEKLKRLKISNESLKNQVHTLEQELKKVTSVNKEMEEKILELKKVVEFENTAISEVSQLKEKLTIIQAENHELKDSLEQLDKSKSVCHLPDIGKVQEKVERISYDDSNGSSRSRDKLCMDDSSPSEINHMLSASSEKSNMSIYGIDAKQELSMDNVSSPKLMRQNEMLYTKGIPFKGASVEIFGGKSSILNDAHIQIDHLTQAYLESEKTNKLLSDQVTALKEEIRRMQRGHERLDLADNLEYLKNIVIKFVSLEGQVEKQRLIPVLSTMLKLSPEEQNKLLSATQNHEKNSFFRII